MIRYGSWQPASEAVGAEAKMAVESLPGDRREISINCEYTGKKTIAVRLGTTAERAYAYFDDTQSGAYLASSEIQDKIALFQSAVSYLTERTWFVSSDPRPPDYFGSDPPLEDLPGLLRETFGIDVEVTA